ncbi:MAG: hypothetical protein KGZ79_15210 [Dethiobacter sp.]|jgi:hypothetical protein|nr:hypothetical protein [Dethiobacter sp.]
MTWAAMLISVSAYGWYLVIAFNQSTGLPVSFAGLAGLIFLSLLPTYLGLVANRSLFASGPTVLLQTKKLLVQ